MSTSIDELVDLSIIHYRNPQLVIKKAVEYVENSRTLGVEIVGLAFEVLPTHGAKQITIKSKRDGREEGSKRYSPPETWDRQLTLACYLYAIAKYTSLGNRAYILCTKSRSRGDLENSISTKHKKSKLQDKLDDILSDEELLEGFRTEAQRDQRVPEELSPIQRELVVRSVGGEVSQSNLATIRKSHETDDITIYNEWKSMSYIKGLASTTIPIKVNFPLFSINQVVELLESEGLAPSLRKEIEFLKEESKREITRLKNRTLLQRILNR